MRFEIADGVASVTLDAPGRRNSLDMPMRLAIPGMIDEARDAAVHALIITG